MITASDNAIKKLKEGLIQRCSDVGLGYRVVKNSDESGHAVFSMKLDKERPGDEVVASQGISIFLDPASAALVKDCELDYLDEPTDGFYLKNERVAAGDSQVGGGENI